MIENSDNKKDFKDKLNNFYKGNKKKIIFLLLALTLVILSIIFLQYKNDQKNSLIAEKYVQAGIYLSSNNSNDAKLLYEEIILSKNKFYSILALNIIIEKKLSNAEEKIIKYFDLLEKSNLSKANKDLLILKKGLYLLKVSDTEEGYDLLKSLIEKNSNLKTIAEELLSK